MSEPPTIDDLLAEAQVLQDEYTDADVEALCDLALRELAMPRLAVAAEPAAPPPPEAGRPEIMAVPVLYTTDREQAAHDLDLVASLFTSVPDVTTLLEELMRDGVAPEGALVFACMLHLIGHAEAACFWWRFAAGAEVYGGAYCLFLHHRARAEYREARYWRRFAGELAARARDRTHRRPCPHAPLADHLGRSLLRECRLRSGRPRLPAAVESALNRLVAEGMAGCAPRDATEAAAWQQRILVSATAGLRALGDAIAGRLPVVPGERLGRPCPS